MTNLYANQTASCISLPSLHTLAQSCFPFICHSTHMPLASARHSASLSAPVQARCCDHVDRYAQRREKEMPFEMYEERSERRVDW